jgi:hypothetical protein
MDLEQTLLQIAQQHLDIETLETRRMDALDFHEVAVWAVREALQAAYIAGLAEGAQRALEGCQTNP